MHFLFTLHIPLVGKFRYEYLINYQLITIPRIMRLFFFVAVLFCTTTSSLFSQDNPTFDKHWKLLLNNQRPEALSAIKKSKEKDIASFLTKEIIKAENGNFTNSKTFVEELMTYDDFEYYLYALWTQNFFFDAYLDSGFNSKNSTNISAVDLKKVNNTTVVEALKYIKSIVSRHNDDWADYFKRNQEITAIKKWQYCGPFENLNGSGLDIVYAPEVNAISKEDFNANSNGYINWYENKENEKEAYQFYSNHSEFGAGVNYAQTFVNIPEERRVVFRLGSSALSKVWINDVVILENTNDGLTDLDAYNVEITLPKGINRNINKECG